MKTFLLILLTSLSSNAEQKGGMRSAVSTYSSVLAHLEKIAPHLGAKNAALVADSISKSCIKYKLNCTRFTAILAQESMFRISAYNRTSADHGIGQINQRTAEKLGLNTDRLKSDLNYSIDSAAQIYAWFKAVYEKKEPKTWFCRYNVGTGKLIGTRARNCYAYIDRVSRFFN